MYASPGSILQSMQADQTWTVSSQNQAHGETTHGKLKLFSVHGQTYIYEVIWQIDFRTPLSRVKCASLKGGKEALFFFTKE